MNTKIIGFVLLVLSFVGGWMWMDYQSALHQPALVDRTVLIEIEKGDSLDRISDKLVAQKLVLKPFWFKVIALQKNALKKLKTGEYELTPGLTVPKIVALFVQGKTKQHVITFPEGWSFKEILREIEKNTDLEHTLVGVTFENVMNTLNLATSPASPTTAGDGGSVAIGTTAWMQDDCKGAGGRAEGEQRREQLPREPMRQASTLGALDHCSMRDSSDEVVPSAFTQSPFIVLHPDVMQSSVCGPPADLIFLAEVRLPVAVAAIAREGDAASQPGTGEATQSPEGLFFPDTYFFEKHTSDVSLLKRAYDKMQRVLQQEWPKRTEGLPFKTPYEALILASIVEKETGAAAERPQIAGVFIRRLEQKMLLQTDPTVIYGMGESYRGDIKAKDLTTATPYNTYVISGLPPTPIAMPGRAALHAVLHPDKGDSVYFVARGDGTHVFSTTLKDHNLAVDKFQRNKK